MSEQKSPERLHELLCAYVLGEGTPEERAEVEAALETSEELRAERERLQATIGLVQNALPKEEVLSEEKTSELIAAANRGRMQPVRPWYLSPAVRIAAAVVIFAGLIALWRTPSTPPHATAPELQTASGQDAGKDVDLARAPQAAAGELGGLKKNDSTGRALRGLGYVDGGAASASKSEQAEADDEHLMAQMGYVESRAKESNDLAAQVQPAPEEEAFEEPPALSRFSLDAKPVEELEDLERVVENRLLNSAEPTQREQLAQQGDGHRGPGDTVPPSVALGEAPTELRAVDGPFDNAVQLKRSNETVVTGSDDFYLGRGEKAQSPPVLHDSLAVAPSGGTAAPSSGVPLKIEGKKVRGRTATRAGGGGPSSPGPHSPGPHSPGPPARSLDRRVSGSASESQLGLVGGDNKFAGRARATPPATPGAPAAPTAPPRADDLRSEVTGEDVTRLDGELLEELSALGYVDSEDADDFSVGQRFYRDGDNGEVRAWTPAMIDAEVERILQSCRRRPVERPRDMFFRFWGDNPYEVTRLDGLSTFSVDVDTASYALARRYLNDGHLPTKAQVRTEEFVNYFKPDVAAPTEDTFAIHTDLAPSLFGGRSDRWMMRVVVRGKEVSREERQPLCLTFVIDVSGSMKEDRRLELVKHSLRLLTSELDSRDAISIVAFSNEARLVLPMTSVANPGAIESALYPLEPGGGTNAEAGLRMGYEQASLALTKGSHNRVVLLSDGVANIGQTDQDRINGDVERHRKQGIYLNTVGVGMDNHNDVFLEQLANKGDGMCNYVDSEREARRALVENFTGAFEPIARDVKVQVEFDPNQVERYRLLGYENRAVADQDFRNDAVDAGEINAGHQVVALYEIERNGTATNPETPLATVRLRWKAPHPGGVADAETEVATERETTVHASSASGDWRGTSAGYRRAALVAQFAEFLRRSYHARTDSLDKLIAESKQLATELQDEDFVEFVALVEASRNLVVQELERHDELSRTIDNLRENCYLHAQIEELHQRLEGVEQNDRLQQQLEELERQNDTYRDLLSELLKKKHGGGRRR